MGNDSSERPARGTAVRDGADAEGAAPRRLLDIMRQLRARERRYLAGLLHDGPVQELAAAVLELGLARRATGTSQHDELGVIIQQVDAAGRSLRNLQDELWPFPRSDSGLVTALQRRTAWLLGTPLAVHVGEGAAGLPAAQITVVADVVELILAGLAGGEAPTGTFAAVRADQDLIFLDLGMVSATDGDQAFGGPAATAVIHELAAAIQARADVSLHDRHLRILMEMHRWPLSSVLKSVPQQRTRDTGLPARRRES
jgi:hypothetical protein